MCQFIDVLICVYVQKEQTHCVHMSGTNVDVMHGLFCVYTFGCVSNLEDRTGPLLVLGTLLLCFLL